MVKLQLMSQAARDATAATQAKIAQTSSIKPKIGTIQTKLSNDSRIGEATRKAQQALSEKYGIPTFDTKGFISTVPTTRPIDPTINVGTGAFTDTAFQKSITSLIQQTQAVVNPISGFINTITNGVNSIIDTLFPKLDLSDLSEEQKKKINEIDSQIDNYQKQSDYYAKGAEQGSFSDASTVQKLGAKIDELERSKTELLRRYRISNDLLKEINAQIEKLQTLSQTSTVTKEIKETVLREIQRASELIEQKLREQADIKKEVITQLQNAMLEANKILKVVVKEEQEEVKEKIKSDFDLWKTLTSLGKPTIKEKIDAIIEDFRAQKGAIDVLIGTGEFRARLVSQGDGK